MNHKVVSLRSVDTVKNIHLALKSPHHGFPVLNLNGQVIGLISKNFLFVLISKRAYYAHQSQKHFVINGHLKEYFKKNILK
jgi:CBS-domain-containing membrane protein